MPGVAPSVRIDPAVLGRHVGVDKRRFERVMVNLMENAANYGGGAREIAVGPLGDEQVVVTVDDAGPGIDPAERTKVFERFYRGSASGRRGTGTGSGLGLALGVRAHAPDGRRRPRSRRRLRAGLASSCSLPVLNGDEARGRRAREAAHGPAVL